MAKNRIEFKITKDSKKADVKLEGMSIEAAKAFSILLTSTANIISQTSGPDDLKIKIKSGSAVLIAEGNDSEIERIEQSFDEVLAGKSSNKALVSNWRDIQSLFVNNGIDYEASFYHEGVKRPFVQILKTTKKLRAKPEKHNLSTHIKFFKGTLLAVGGKNPNIHIEDENKNKITIKCTEQSAKKANAFLYDNIRISVWGKESQKENKYELCDSYWAKDPVDSFENFLIEFEETENEVQALKLLHYECRKYLDEKDYGNLRKFLRLFTHESIDVNILKTILLITQSFINNEKLKKPIADIQRLFNDKMREYRRKKIKNLLKG